MTTFSGPRAAVVGPADGLAGCVKIQHGAYTFGTTALVVNDVYKLCKIPAKILVHGGYLVMDNIDSNATETIDIDIGWADNGGGSATYTDTGSGEVYTNMGAGAANSAGFVNSGVLTADGVTGLVAAGQEIRHFYFTKPVYFSQETQVQGLVNAIAATMGGGVLGIYVNYRTL